MKNIINRLAILVVGVVLLNACNQDQEVAGIIDATQKPLATITTDGDASSIAEGDSFTYTVAMSKFMKEDVEFAHREMEGNESIHEFDYLVTPGILVHFTDSVEVTLDVIADDFPEESKKLTIDIGSFELSENWQMSPESDVVTIDVEIENVNDPNALSIGFIWEDPDHIMDFDLLVENESLGSWSTQGGTGNNPEIDTSIRSDYVDGDPNAYDGVYLVGIDPYSVPDGDISFSCHVGYPDGTVEIFDGVFNLANTDDYIVDEFTAWGAPMYRVLRVVQTGNSFDVSFAF